MPERIPEETLDKLRSISCLRVLRALEVYISKDTYFKPKLNPETMRIVVDTAKFSGELVITGQKFFAPSLNKGGCGAIDFLMLLERSSFRPTVSKLMRLFNV
jgi:hypothetical protein